MTRQTDSKGRRLEGGQISRRTVNGNNKVGSLLARYRRRKFDAIKGDDDEARSEPSQSHSSPLLALFAALAAAWLGLPRPHLAEVDVDDAFDLTLADEDDEGGSAGEKGGIFSEVPHHFGVFVDAASVEARNGDVGPPHANAATKNHE